LLLLRSLPPARHAALDHLRAVFDEQVCSHLAEREAGGRGPGVAGGVASGPLAEVVQEVQRVLSGFVRGNPRAWAPPVSAWAVELMGQLSSKYGGRPGVPRASSLNELLQLWMSCAATRALMDLYTQCLSAMAAACPEACVDALLDTSVQHSPHFDWVVAHIGSSFPNTIISRVLSCGLRDFCAHGGGAVAAESPFFAAAADSKRVPKMASVVGILGHLASRHAGSIKQELLRMFHEGLGAREPPLKATVPFLLQLAVMSPPLLAAVSAELVDSLSPAVLNQLHQHFVALPREELEGTVAVVVHLICQTSAGAFRLLQFLLFGATAGALEPGDPRAASLLDTNRRFTLNLAGGVWSVFHAGVVGRGLKAAGGGEGRRDDEEEEEEEEEVAHNTQAFLTLLLRCCCFHHHPHGDRDPVPTIHPEAAKAVAAALVENVCPEAAGGELAWPPEEQARGTVERDLRICRRFREHPLLFPLLRVVALGRPALCYCSVLLRGLLGALVAFWDACRERRATAAPWHLDASCALVACMAEGSLLPPALGNVHEVFPHLAPFEVHLVLLSVWEYLRENSPLPQRFTFRDGAFHRDFARDGARHLAVLHSVLHRNIQHLGGLAGRFQA
ncbi:INT5 protein, partial [Crotophaga sulcirostris]|nr:INT5 protein [Crotophaga sulcirostris]